MTQGIVSTTSSRCGAGGLGCVVVARLLRATLPSQRPEKALYYILEAFNSTAGAGVIVKHISPITCET